MIEHQLLIARLRDWRGDPDEVMSEAADALEAHVAEIERLEALAGGYANENLNLKAQLGAAQGQLVRSRNFVEDMCNETFDTWTTGYRMQQIALNIQSSAAPTAQQAQPEPSDTRVHLAGPDKSVYYVLHADGVYSEASPQPTQPERTGLTNERVQIVCDFYSDGIDEDGKYLFSTDGARKLIEAVQQAQPEQSVKTWCEYVAGMVGCYLGEPVDSEKCKAIAAIIERRLWALPKPVEQAQPERAPLSDTRIEDVYRHIPDFHQWTFSAAMLKFARAIEAAHGIKQGGQQ
jgi:hypothetical protein